MIAMGEYDIFISYRRVGGFETAKHLYDLLSHDGFSVSFDIDTLREGDFDRTLLERIESCQDFILIVDKHAFDRTLDASFNPKNDWLRQELSYALYLDKNILPVLLAGASFPDNLPKDIRSVTSKNGPKYSQDYFDSFYCRLKSFLHSKPNSMTYPVLELSQPDKPFGAEIHIETDVDCAVFRYKEKILAAKCGEDNIVYLQKGRHRLTFVSNLFSDVREQVVIDIPSSEYSDFVSIQLLLRELDKIPFEVVENKGKYGCADSQGVTRIPCIYDAIEDYFKYCGIAGILVGERWGVINKAGQVIVPPTYEELGIPNDHGLIMAMREDGKCGAINLKGQVIIPFQYEPDRCLSLPNDSRLEGFIKDEKYGFLDSMGKEAIPFIYDECDDCGFGNEFDVIWVKKDGKYGFINSKGETVIPFIYDLVEFGPSFYRNGVMWVVKDGKYGFINAKGETVISFDYDWADTFDDNTGLICVEKDGRFGFIDETGKTIIPFIYEDAFGFSGGLAYVKNMGKIGFINDKGEVILPLEYDEASHYLYNDVIKVCKDSKWGIANKKGNLIIPCIYDDIDNRDGIKVKEGEKWRPVDLRNSI